MASIPLWTRRLARGAWLDRAREDRHSSRSVPRTGGIGWLTGWALGVVFAALLSYVHTRTGVYCAGLVLLAFVLGLLDDQGRVSGVVKGMTALLLLGLFLRATLLWVDFDAWRPTWSGFAPAASGHAALAMLGRATASVSAANSNPVWFLTVLGFAAAVHLAFQIFDNLDGVVGAASLVGLLHLALGTGTSEFAILGLVGASASLGFLAWNHPPARSFLGNGGSQAVGLLVAGLLGAALLRAGSPRSLAAIALPFAWPLLDLGFVVVSRLARRTPPWVGGRDHTTHLLARRIGDVPTFLFVLCVSALLAVVSRLI
ncbi:MAG: hypothetical protein R3E97_17720 [Candidatus Eisenbacteria bacterium]